MRDESALIRDMLDSALRVQRQIANTTFDEFLADETMQDAVVLRLMVIGEAAKMISASTRALLPLLPFDDMVKMRNLLAHVYWNINYKIVWQTASVDIPDLIRHLRAWAGAAGGSGTDP